MLHRRFGRTALKVSALGLRTHQFHALNSRRDALALLSRAEERGLTYIDVAGADKGPWYREIGQGMGAALNMASAINGYVLADRGTWLSFRNRGELGIAVEGDKRLFNQYGVMLVNPDKHRHVKKDLGQAFVDWLVSSEGQKAIADYKINGQQLFFPNADVPGA